MALVGAVSGEVGSLYEVLAEKNTLNTHRWSTREVLRVAIVTWIERTYHRRQPALGRLTPIEYQTTMTPHALLISQTKPVN